MLSAGNLKQNTWAKSNRSSWRSQLRMQKARFLAELKSLIEALPHDRRTTEDRTGDDAGTGGNTRRVVAATVSPE